MAGIRLTAAKLGLKGRQCLTRADLALIFTAWRQAQADTGVVIDPMPESTVSMYLYLSKPAAAGRPKRRYQDCPIPAPVYVSGRPMWLPDQGETLDGLIRRLLRWFVDDRPGQGVGGGPKPAKKKQTP